MHTNKTILDKRVMFVYVKHILLILREKREQPRNADTVMVINNTLINYTHSNFVQATSLQYEAEYFTLLPWQML